MSLCICTYKYVCTYNHAELPACSCCMASAFCLQSDQRLQTHATARDNQIPATPVLYNTVHRRPICDQHISPQVTPIGDALMSKCSTT